MKKTVRQNIVPQSLQAQIKKEIGNRVIISSLIILIAIVGLTFYDLSSSLQRLQTDITHHLKATEDFTVSEMLLNNPQAIRVKLKDLNLTNKRYTVKWMPYKKANFNILRWRPPFGWEYNYQLANIAGYSFGYFKVSGSLLNDNAFIYDLIIRVILLLVFFSVLLLFMYPLTSKIPKKLFIEPINHFLEMLASDQRAHKKNTGLPVELATIENKIKYLMEKTKEQERYQAALDIAEMTRHVAHDLRNYLSGLHETINLSNNLSDEERGELTGYVADIYNMSENLLEKYRTTKNSCSKRENVLVLNQIKKALILANKQKSTQHKIINKLENTIYSCFSVIEPQKFQRIINNLINNAVEANSTEVHVNAYCNDLVATIKIIDNGVGIPDAILKKIGQAEITHGKKNGNGIGLYQAYKTIKSWGGQISIASKLKSGAEITITLPCSTRKPKWFVPQIDLSSINQIVTVDDDPNIHKKWNNTFKKIPNIKIINFDTPRKLEEFIAIKENKDNTFFLIDYQLGIKEPITGVDLIRRNSLEKEAILVTGKAEDASLKAECEEYNLKLLDKINIDFVPIRY